MTEPHLAMIVTADVRALALDSGHPSSPPADGMFRDSRSYALAQRARNLVARGGDIATARRQSMPVYAARAGRVAAGITAAVYSGAWLGSLRDDDGHTEIHVFLMATFVLSAIAYVIARPLARRRFQRRLAEATPPLPEDPELAPRPGAIAEHGRAQTDRLDAWATGATLAAVAAFIPALVYTVVIAHYGAYGPAHDVLSLRGLVICIVLGFAVALLVADAAQRARRTAQQPAWLRYLGGSLGLALGLAIALVPAQHIEYAFSGGATSGPRGLAIPLCLELSALLIGSWLALRIRAREHERLTSA